ncbi:fumarylacetoacetase [Pseudorhodoferax sp.]|uniref:fumarylacetoacetase n=1 Tax=Pseudorhodoferax sp. TaxID=1993553 RepID=UPI002DD66AA9|nr:fumarylacetoacetase [Pseudorhodoferax sp.]
MTLTDATHAPRLKSWVSSANSGSTDFPIQNLPYGRFRPAGTGEPWRIGVAIGDQVLDLKLALAPCPWAPGLAELLQPLADGDLNAFMVQGRKAWKQVRAALSAALAEGSGQAPFLERCLRPQAACEMALPCRIGDYTDFYAGIHHATTIGKLFRPDNPLLPNYKWVPIGYHGRASSIGLGGTVKRPSGQLKGAADAPVFGPSQRLDYELEVGAFVGRANAQGEPVPLGDAEDALFGLVLLNDWSARDIQAWEYQPLGPFLAKSFASSISPWIVTMEALAPFRHPFTRPDGDPQPLPYLDGDFNRASGAIDMTLEVWLQTAAMRAAGHAPVRLSQSNLSDAYWTWAQMLTHHTSNGCNLQPGDLLGSGTLSGPSDDSRASLMELSAGGKQPLSLPGGETRTFLQHGDTVTMRAWCFSTGAVRIGLGEVSGTIVG